MAGREPITYEQSGVNYDALDSLKRLAGTRAALTASNLERNFGYQEVSASRGESAYVIERDEDYLAMVIEGLGTKNLVADELVRQVKLAALYSQGIAHILRRTTGLTYYDSIGQCMVGTFANDIITVGAMPMAIGAHMAVGEAEWFKDEQRTEDLVNGFGAACDLAGAAWGGGETPALKGIIQPGTIELSGFAVGEIKPKDRLALGDKLIPGDSIILIESNGIHANGLTLARTIEARKAKLGRRLLHAVLPHSFSNKALPQGYLTELPDGITYGEALLQPTSIYVNGIRGLFANGIDVHYMANITGHGWRKLMRAKENFSYVINQIPEPQPVFGFIQEQSGNTDQEMYGNFNMGAGFAVFVSPSDAKRTLESLRLSGYPAIEAGHVEEGPKRVIINPKDVTFESDSLEIR